MEDLKKIAKKTTFSKADLRLIEELSVDNEMDFATTTCQDKYREQLILLIEKLCVPLEQFETGKYILRPTVDVFFRGMRVNVHTFTDEIGAQMIDAGFGNLILKNEK